MYPHRGGQQSCLAHGKECAVCHKPNHSTQYCHTRRSHHKTSKGNSRRQQQHRKQQFQHFNKTAAALEAQIDNDSSSDDEFVFTVGHIGQASKDKHPKVLATIGKIKMKVLLDTGSSVNLLDRKQFEILNRHNKIALTKAQHKIYAYGSRQPLPIKGSLRPR